MEKEKRRCGSGYIPEEIVEEILVNLPVPSMVRFKAVSREWRATIESKSFIKRHMIGVQKSLESQARILVLSSEPKYDHLAFDTILFSTNGIVREISPFLPITPLYPFQGSKISEPCDGLFCLFSDTRMSVFNPATTCYRRLPNPTSTIPYDQRRHFTLLGIGREKSGRKRYKLVCLFECNDQKVNESTKCMVFALDSNTWSNVDPPPHCRVHYGHSLVHLDGVIYCFTRSTEAKVLAFDLHTEKFQSFSITPDIKSRVFANLSMRVLNHRLCVFNNNNDLLLKTWGLDINKRSWEMMHSIDLSTFSVHIRIIPMATINNNLVVTNYFHNLWLLYDSENHIWHHTISFPGVTSFDMLYFETLVSAYQ